MPWGSPNKLDCQFLLGVLCNVSPVPKTVLLERREGSPTMASPPFRPPPLSPTSVSHCSDQAASDSLAGSLSSYVLGTRSLLDFEFEFGFWNIYTDFDS